ncbi:acylphosphatase-1 isoform X2 [Drosophila albomicans]|uniref:acylphosphatase n=1 Tax=Drosophila albomicans TaxID=7291 RepID=A0A9C6SX01_DROAB|nr:acylphosphatase-1 isoform X2 [Drosophila albomicans]
MKSPSVATQTEKSALRTHGTKKTNVLQRPEPAKYTLRRAQKLGVRGWCMNSENGTILGLIQGNPRSFEAMRLWLTYTGSPTSRIDKCVFGPTTELVEFTFEEFTIRM